MGAKMQPIRDMAAVNDIEITLSKRDDEHGRRMFLMFEIGIRLGLRIGDLLQLRVGDIRGKSEYTYRPGKQRHKGGGRGVTITATIDQIPTQIPLRTLSAPSFGSVSKTASTLIWKGKLPLTRASAMFLHSSSEKSPEIEAVPPVIGSLMFGAQYSLPSRTIAN